MQSVFGLFASAELNSTIFEKIPQVKGPYSQAIQAGEFLFISGQFSIDPITNQLVGNTIEDQTIQVLANIEAILSARGLSFQNVVKTEIYLKNLDDLKRMNPIYASKFSYPIKPARQTVEVSRLPLDALVEISCIALTSGIPVYSIPNNP